MIKILENGLASYPKFEGRWPCTSGLKFKFDSDQPAGKRIIADSITLTDGSPFDLEKVYDVAVTNFIASGRDGYQAFLDPSIDRLRDDEEATVSM